MGLLVCVRLFRKKLVDLGWNGSTVIPVQPKRSNGTLDNLANPLTAMVNGAAYRTTEHDDYCRTLADTIRCISQNETSTVVSADHVASMG